MYVGAALVWGEEDEEEADEEEKVPKTMGVFYWLLICNSICRSHENVSFPKEWKLLISLSIGWS